MSLEKANNINIKKTYRTEKQKKAITNRLNRIEGQIRGINQMIKNDRYCDDILIQISAVKKSLESLANNILECHLKGCVTSDLKNGNIEIIDEVMNLIKKL